MVGRRPVCWAAGPVIAMSVLFAAPAMAATLTVTKTADTADGVCNADCSLREAIIAANALPRPGTLDDSHVIKVPAGTYRLTIPGRNEGAGATGDLDITALLRLEGAGARDTILAGDGTDRVLDVLQGAFTTISGVTVTGGGGVGQGGGIRAEGIGFQLYDAAIVGNSTSAAESHQRQGGGLYVTDGTAVVERVLVAHNSATARAGDPGPPQGGGIFAAKGVGTLRSSTLAENVADGRAAAGGADGGGYYQPFGNLAMEHLTVVANRVLVAAGFAGRGSGLYASFGGPAQLLDSIVAGNTVNGAGADEQCFGNVSTLFSVLPPTPGDCGSGDSDPRLNETNSAADPLLGPLRDNGGATDTMAPASGSPAIDQTLCFGSHDQRGVARPQQPTTARCDSGAVESAFSPPAATAEPTPVATAAATPTPAPPAVKPPAPISAKTAFTLPSAKKCLSRRNFRIRIRKLPGVTWAGARVFVNGKRVKTVRRSRISAPVDLRGLPRGRYTVRIVATTTDGRTVSDTRKYRTCAPKRPRTT